MDAVSSDSDGEHNPLESSDEEADDSDHGANDSPSDDDEEVASQEEDDESSNESELGDVEYSDSFGPCEYHYHLEYVQSGTLSRRGLKFMVWEGVLSSFHDARVTNDPRQDPWHIKTLLDENEPKLQSGLWESLPQEIVNMVVVRSPPAAQARFRLLCKSVNALLNCPGELVRHYPRGRKASCTVLCEPRHLGIKVYSHDEDTWFRIPCLLDDFADVPPRWQSALEKIHLPSLPNQRWRLADVDGQVFCYWFKGVTKINLYFAVCNPLMRGSTLWLPPCSWDGSKVDCVKLVVDQKAKEFKVVAVSYRMTAVFDSVAVSWTTASNDIGPCVSYPAGCWFVWKSLLYGCTWCHCNLWVLDMASGNWNQVELDWNDHLRHCGVVSNRDELMLVQVRAREDNCIYIWKQLNDIPDSVPRFSARSWKRQRIALPEAVRIIAVDFRDCLIHGNEYVCFYGDKMNQWIKYIFSTQTWHLMPRLKKAAATIPWLDWQPGLEVNLKEWQ